MGFILYVMRCFTMDDLPHAQVMQGRHLDRPKARPHGLYETMEKCWLAVGPIKLS